MKKPNADPPQEASTDGRGRRQLLPLLLEVEAALEHDLKLEALATRYGYSPFHFHRMFSQSLGETPRKHVERMRLEKAALLLAITDEPILEVGLSVGYNNPETFTRNFKKFLGYTPVNYRRMAKTAQRERMERNRFFRGDGCSISEVRFEVLPACTLLGRRHLGDYAAVTGSFGTERDLWVELGNRAAHRQLDVSGTPIGLFYDDPTLTPPELQRSDLCLPVTRRFIPGQDVRCIEFRAGMYALVAHLGPTATLDQAIRNLADAIRRAEGYDFDGMPLVVFMRQAHVGGEAGVHRREVAFPVKSVNAE